MAQSSAARKLRAVPDEGATRQYADVEEVRSFAAELSDKYLECRDTGHIWRRRSATWSPHLGEYRRVHRCSMCRSERIQRLSDRGAILSSTIHYAPGYLHAGFGRIVGDGRDALRLETMGRFAVEDEDEE